MANWLTGNRLESPWRDPEPSAPTEDRFHVAINMDGNGRWALMRGRPRAEGHVAGERAVRRTIESATGRNIPLATWTWDCGRWDWLGHVGHAIGWLSQSRDRGVPTLAIHPRDLARGFWPGILRLTRELLEKGYEPNTLTGLLEARC